MTPALSNGHIFPLETGKLTKFVSLRMLRAEVKIDVKAKERRHMLRSNGSQHKIVSPIAVV